MKRSDGLRDGAIAFLLLGGAGAVVIFGAGLMGMDGPATARHWLLLARGPWALPLAVAAFAVLAFVGVPQFVLIAAAAAAFGPMRGAAYSWIGTMVSALLGFGLGRAAAGRWLTASAGGATARFLALIKRNGFAASLGVRLVPFAPFVVVNMAAGLSPMSWAAFAGGTAIGIVPKIAVAAFAGSALVKVATERGVGPVVLPILFAAVWLTAVLSARRWMKP